MPRHYVVEFFFRLLDGLGFFRLYELVSNALATHTRRLTDREVTVLRGVFGESLPYDRIRIDEYARLGPRRYRFFYVSFHTINSWGPMPDDILVHEAVHVWQYRRVGAVYIPRALRAQRSLMGYNYNGVAGLRYVLDPNRPALSYEQQADPALNYEQQADAVADWFRLNNGLPARWLGEYDDRDEALKLLTRLVEMLKEKDDGCR